MSFLSDKKAKRELSALEKIVRSINGPSDGNAMKDVSLGILSVTEMNLVFPMIQMKKKVVNCIRKPGVIHGKRKNTLNAHIRTVAF